MDDDDRGRPSANDTGGSEGDDELAVLFSGFARTLQRQDDPNSTLVEIVRSAVAMIPGCDEASISVVLGRRKVTSHAPSGELPRLVDALQEELAQGPCLDAVYEQETVRVPTWRRRSAGRTSRPGRSSWARPECARSSSTSRATTSVP